MIDPSQVPAVGDEEIVARYVLQSSHVRRSDRSLKPDAFMPHPHADLSVTRHYRATEDELWLVGESVALKRGRTLYGRGDFAAASCRAVGLGVEAAPLPDNPNHANVLGWPVEKPLQKIMAQQIAAVATFAESPTGT